jgi:glycosyltransferase involved in cell wall biosynthesis
MSKIKIIIITDAWEPQVNGVVVTYKNIIKNLPKNVSVCVIHPLLFSYFSFPFYKEVKIALCTYGMMYHLLKEETLYYKKLGYTVYYHIATEGVLGFNAKRVLDKEKYQYTTAYHTKFPEFFNVMYKIPIKYTRWYFDWFHSKSKYVLCSSESNATENSKWNSVVLDKGYMEESNYHNKMPNYIKTLLYVGRVSKEKNIDDFCKLQIPNTKKIVVGDGPYLQKLKQTYTDVEFVGYKFGKDLVSYYQNSDVFVFPSKTDTYGIVILEAMACGTPVAAYPVTGPIDQINNGVNGFTDIDLELAVTLCLDIPRSSVYKSVKDKTWHNSAKKFVNFVTLMK